MSSPRDQLREIGDKVTRRIADDIVEEIRGNPRTPDETLHHQAGTPHLRDSFHVVAKGDGYDIVSVVDYWRFVEYGHRTRLTRHPRPGTHVQHWVPAQPYLRPAIAIALAKAREQR
jgi:hypothetical protein